MDNESKKEINEFRFKSLVPLIHSYRKIKRKKILDFGCGSGHSTFAMALEGGECTGIDISKSCIPTLKKLPMSLSDVRWVPESPESCKICLFFCPSSNFEVFQYFSMNFFVKSDHPETLISEVFC